MWTLTDPVPSVVRSIYRAQSRHSRLISNIDVQLGFSATLFADKHSLQLSDIPLIPDGGWIYFRRPRAAPHPSRHPPANDLARKEAIETQRAVTDFVIRFEAWSGRLRTELAVLACPVREVDAAFSWFVYTGVSPWVWSEELVQVVRKWSCVREREDELDSWVDEAIMWIQRLDEAVGVSEARGTGCRSG